ncbi:MAG TPA: hypothetical protein VF331_11905 [Polyangiales bacterium]
MRTLGIASRLAGAMALALVGCGGPPQTALAALTDRQLHVSLEPYASGDPGLLVISLTSKDHVTGCLTLDPDTKIKVNGKTFSLGTPNATDDSCPKVSIALGVEEDGLDPRSPAEISVGDASLTMHVRVTNLFGKRTVRGPSNIFTCSSVSLRYDAPATDVLQRSSTEIGFSSATASSSSYVVSSSLVFAVDATEASGSNILFDVPYLSPGQFHGAGALVVDASAELPIEVCIGASACDAKVATHSQAPASLGDGC